MDVLMSILTYLNSRGYYFDSNYGNCENPHPNYNNQEQYSVPARRLRNRGSQRNRSELNKCKALENTNLKKGLETKIQEGNKGYEILAKMGYEHGKGLGGNAEGVLEPIMLEKKTDRKGLGFAETSKSVNKILVTSQVSKMTSKKGEKKRLGIEGKKGAVDTQTQKQNANKKQTKNKKKVVPSTQQVQKPKLGPNQVIKAASTNQLALAKAELKKSKSNNKIKFSVKDPCTCSFLSALDQTFNSEIKLMQNRLLAEASLNPLHTDNDMIIAKIYIKNDFNIADDVFEFIRTELVGWIGVYQQEGMDTPIFHSITNNSSFITIICDNKYAFDCVERCVEDILQMKTMRALSIIPLPHITPIIYCFDAKYEGIASDPELFLLQLRLHKPRVYSDNWVVVCHEVCPDKRETYFIFLIDERSALALDFYYSLRFCICLQQVTFHIRGIVRETV